MGSFRIAFLILLFVFPLTFAAAEELTVMNFNLENYFLIGGKGTPKKLEQSKIALNEVIVLTNPDIMMFSEVGGEEAIAHIVARLKESGLDYPYYGVMHGEDESRHLGYVSRIKPFAVNKIDNLTYRLKPKFKNAKYLENVRVQRGFLHVIFKVDDYTFHVIGVHLKANVFHRRYNQTDMRRMEARQLKYHVNGIISADPSANVLLVGDMNDVYSSNPLVILRGMNEKLGKRLFDLKPADAFGATWTHWWKFEDSYSRIDYMLASPSLLPEIDFSKNRIAHVQEHWVYASDHRPLVAVISTIEKPDWTEEGINVFFHDGVYKGQQE